MIDRYVLCRVAPDPATCDWQVTGFFTGQVRLLERVDWGFSPLEAELTTQIDQALRFTARFAAHLWAYRLAMYRWPGDPTQRWEVRPLQQAVLHAPVDPRHTITHIFATGNGALSDLDTGDITRPHLRDWAAGVLLEVGGIGQRDAPDFTDRVDRVVSDCLAALVERRVALAQELLR